MDNQNPPIGDRQLSDVKQKLLTSLLNRERATNSVDGGAVPRRPADVPIPLSYAQEQVWLHLQLAENAPIYNEPMTLHRHGLLDEQILKKCSAELVRRHEIWRTTFDMIDGQPIQIVGPPPGIFPLTIFDLRHMPEKTRNDEALRLAASDARRPFDLRRGPLLRAIWVKLADEEHRLYMTFHQLVFDGVTAYSIILPELMTLYESFSGGWPSPLPEPALQYADFAYWQRRVTKQSPEGLAYWKENLAGDLPILQWPSDSRPKQQSHRSALEHFSIPSKLVHDLQALSRAEGVSMYVAMLSGFAALLHRYTNQDEIIIGGLSAGRKSIEMQGIAGDFVNPLPLRIHLKGNPTFRELLKRVREVVLGGLAHDDVPFQEIVRIVGPKADLSRNPLFQIVLSLQPQMPGSSPGWNLTTEDVGNGGSKTDLMIVMDHRADTLFGPITYNPDVFDASTIRLTLGHWQTLLSGALANPECHLSDLPVLTADEQALIVNGWNHTAQEYPPETIVELFESRAENTPDAIAAIYQGKRLSYGELNRQANQLAHSLKDMDISPETLVGICAERSLEMLAGLLGILKTGGAYVPLDPNYPQDRLEFMLRDCGANVLVIQSRFQRRFPHYSGQMQVIEEVLHLQGSTSENLPQKPGLDNIAYAMYTSGSTGVPKGVLGVHRGIVNRMRWMWQAFPFAQDEVCCQKTSLSFVDSVWEIFGPLLQGIPSLILPDEVVKEPLAFVQAVHDHQVTRVVLVPSLLRLLLETCPNLAECTGSVRYWVTSGEALSSDTLDHFRQKLPNAMLLNLYGCTEAAGDSTFCDTAEAVALKRVPIGRPLTNTQIHLLDSHLRHVPVGVAAELYIGGDGLARGYLNHPDLTAERFLTVRLEDGRETRLYKTGDLARYLPEGNIEYLGRADDQVKIRGSRVELGEVESALRKFKNVKEAAVALRDASNGDKTLIAYVVPRERDGFQAPELREYLNRTLPPYMIPSQFLPLSELPLSPNGKVNRKALPNPGQVSFENQDQFVPPATPTEQRLAAIWAELLNVPRIGATDNFFDLGGHSLSAIRLFTTIERDFDVRLPPSALLSAPTLRELARVISDHGVRTESSSVVPIQPKGSRPPFFCVHGGGGNVFIYRDLALRLGPDQPVYGLQSRGLDGKQDYVTRIEDMASLYLQDIKSVQPHGPYLLGGYCMGGTIALEIAQQLISQGESVALLALFDTINWSKIRGNSIRAKVNRQVQRLLFHGRNFLLLDLRGKTRFLQGKIEVLQERVRVWKGLLVGRISRTKRSEKSQSSVLADLWQINHNAPVNYVPRPYPGVITDFRPLKQYSGYFGPDMHWDELALGGQDIVVLPVYPAGMLMEPFVKVLAAELSIRMDNAVAAFRSSECVNGR